MRHEMDDHIDHAHLLRVITLDVMILVGYNGHARGRIY